NICTKFCTTPHFCINLPCLYFCTSFCIGAIFLFPAYCTRFMQSCQFYFHLSLLYLFVLFLYHFDTKLSCFDSLPSVPALISANNSATDFCNGTRFHFCKPFLQLNVHRFLHRRSFSFFRFLQPISAMLSNSMLRRVV